MIRAYPSTANPEADWDWPISSPHGGLLPSLRQTAIVTAMLGVVLYALNSPLWCHLRGMGLGDVVQALVAVGS